MPKTSKIQGGTNAGSQVAPPARYITGYAPEFDGRVHCRDELTVASNFTVSGSLTANGDLTATGNLGLFGTTAAAQQANIADPTGGVTSDAEARTAINSILDVLEAYGLMAGA